MMQPHDDDRGSMDIRICFIGDSFVNGTGDPTYLGWTGRVCAAVVQQGYDLTSYNLGVRRETSLQIEQRWQQEVACRLAHDNLTHDNRYQGHLVFSFGANDMTQTQGCPRVDLATSVATARRILQLASQQYWVLMVGPPAIATDQAHTHRIAQLSTRYAALCRDLKIPYLETWKLTAQSTLWANEVKAGDGAHPGAGGYGELAALVTRWQAWCDWFKPHPFLSR